MRYIATLRGKEEYGQFRKSMNNHGRVGAKGNFETLRVKGQNAT